ncbi:MAG: ABC transporter permease [Flavobacteriaceae bacterium]|jgi:ABC-2 type transport system permease protein|nr:ABC transporter permease [Flavobacteriaceae bacterium]MBT3918897.1 ABC transporter permease [Flavobacteriaceae bacterium]MBT6705920.1 ABC transporter permease [Flavobacteriaceae bacterium]
MNHLQLIIKREYLNKVRNKSFIIMTFLSPLIMVLIFTLVAYLSQLNNEAVTTINILDESGLFTNSFKDSESVNYTTLENISINEAKLATETSEAYGLLYIPKAPVLDNLSESITFYSEGSPSISMMRSIENKIEGRVNVLKLEESGIDAKQIEELRINIDAKIETFKGKKTSKLGAGLKLIFGGIAGYLLFMFIIIYGNMIMRSVIEEKTSRIIEIIISSVKPIKLLLGKIFGTTLAGVTQFAVWIVIIMFLSTAISSIFGIDPSAIQSQPQEILGETSNSQQIIKDVLVEINNLPISNLIIMFIFFFIGGYLLYSSLYAAIGAAVDNETDTQQFMLPILMPLILGIYVGFFTVMDNPHGIVSQVFSYIPLTSPVVMLMRIPFGVPLWQQILSLVILFATFMGTVWFASKIYRVGILMYGKKASYREIIKWLKY